GRLNDGVLVTVLRRHKLCYALLSESQEHSNEQQRYEVTTHPNGAGRPPFGRIVGVPVSPAAGPGTNNAKPELLHRSARSGVFPAVRLPFELRALRSGLRDRAPLEPRLWQ